VRKIVWLVGLEPAAATELSAALSPAEFETRVAGGVGGADWEALAEGRAPSVVCVPAEPAGSAPLLEAVRERSGRTPVVVVGRRNEPAEWLTALTRGAADYFTGPFLPGQADWVLSSAVRSRPMAAYLAA
jgi:DNA-binding response OmpR family regulator